LGFINLEFWKGNKLKHARENHLAEGQTPDKEANVDL